VKSFESKLDETIKTDKYLRSAIRNGRGDCGINDQNLLSSLQVYQTEQADQFAFIYQLFMTKSDSPGNRLNEWIESWRNRKQPVVLNLTNSDMDVPKLFEIDQESYTVLITPNQKEQFDSSGDAWADEKKPDEQPQTQLIKREKYISLYIFKTENPDEYFQLQSIVRHAFLNFRKFFFSGTLVDFFFTSFS